LISCVESDDRSWEPENKVYINQST